MEKLRTVGFSFLQLDPAVFYRATVDEILLMVEGERKKRDENFRSLMEAARFTTGTLIRPSLDKGYKGKPTRALFPFPWDDEGVEKEEVTIESINESRERIKARDKKKAVKSGPLRSV